MRKVLVIDDEKGNLTMFRLFLKTYGYDVSMADSGEQGIRMVKELLPDIVFTDIKMPGMDGFDVLKYVKKNHPRTEVIMITGHGDMDLAVQALNLEATDFINKPIQRQALDSALQRAEERLKLSSGKQSHVDLRKERDIVVLDIRGDVNSESETAVMDAFQKAAEQNLPKLLLCFDNTSSVNGAGIAVLIQMLTQAKEQGQKVGITGISKNFEEIFEMVGITRFAQFYDDEKSAMQNL